jgi:hypothetical protein
VVQQPALDPKPMPLGRRALKVHRLPVLNGAADTAFQRVEDAPMSTAARRRLALDGLRVGVGGIDELRDILELAGAESVTSQTLFASGFGPQTFDLTGVPREQLVLFWHEPDGLRGRSFGPSRLRLDVTFGNAPGGAGEVVGLHLVPRVESERQRTLFSVAGNDRLRPVDGNERLGTLGFRVDVPDDSFVLLAPSSAAERATSLGRHLLTDGESDADVLLLFVPSRVTLTPVK